MSELRETIQAAMDGTLEDASTEAPSDVSTPVDSGGGGEVPAAVVEAAGSDVAPDAGDEAAETEAGAAARARDAQGRFAPGSKEAKAEALKAAQPVVRPTSAVAKASTALAANVKPVVPAVTPVPPAEAFKPPQSWKPGAREHFAKLPPEVQAEVARLDKETVGVLRESANARKFAESFNQVVSPYMGAIQSEGGNPLQTVHGLLQTAQALRGPGKAQVVANIIRQFGVSEESLVEALQGQAPQGHGRAAAPAPAQTEFRDPRVDQMLEQRAQALTQRAHRDTAAFSEKAEFIEDVRHHMALLLKEAADRGQGMTLEEAYDAACWANKDVRGTLQKREAAKANAQASTQRARAASSSIRSQPASAGTAGPDGSIRGDIMAAMSKLNSR